MVDKQIPSCRQSVTGGSSTWKIHWEFQQLNRIRQHGVWVQYVHISQYRFKKVGMEKPAPGVVTPASFEKMSVPFFMVFQFIFPFRGRNWHHFLSDGCQRITEPVSHLFFINRFG
jgi:hypothetical protein